MENEELTDENSELQYNNRRTDHLKPWQYKKGQSGNPGGKPVGAISMKTYVKNKLLAMSPEEREEFLEGLDKKIIWEMAEGKAKQDLDLTGEITSKIINVDE